MDDFQYRNKVDSPIGHQFQSHESRLKGETMKAWRQLSFEKFVAIFTSSDIQTIFIVKQYVRNIYLY